MGDFARDAVTLDDAGGARIFLEIVGLPVLISDTGDAGRFPGEAERRGGVALRVCGGEDGAPISRRRRGREGEEGGEGEEKLLLWSGDSGCAGGLPLSSNARRTRVGEEGGVGEEYVRVCWKGSVSIVMLGEREMGIGPPSSAAVICCLRSGESLRGPLDPPIKNYLALFLFSFLYFYFFYNFAFCTILAKFKNVALSVFRKSVPPRSK